VSRNRFYKLLSCFIIIKNDSNRENIFLGTTKITSGLRIRKMNVTVVEHPVSFLIFVVSSSCKRVSGRWKKLNHGLHESFQFYHTEMRDVKNYITSRNFSIDNVDGKFVHFQLGVNFFVIQSNLPKRPPSLNDHFYSPRRFILYILTHSIYCLRPNF
jgi:hypothetical protein